MDSDFGRASDVVSAWFYDDVADLDTTSTRDAKTLLQEWLQGRGMPCRLTASCRFRERTTIKSLKSLAIPRSEIL